MLALVITASLALVPVQAAKFEKAVKTSETEKNQKQADSKENIAEMIVSLLASDKRVKAADTVDVNEQNDVLDESITAELNAAAGKITKGITDMALSDSGKRASGMLGAFSKKVTKSKEAKKTHSNTSSSSSAKKSDVLTYKYNSKMDRDVTEKEYEILCRIVEAEAGDQDVYGRILIVNVILNRVEYTKEFANDIEGVVFEKNQFSPISNGAYYSVTVDDVTREAVNRALKGEDYSDGALYFIWRAGATRSGASYFDTLNYLFKYGCHEFYKY